MSALLSRRHVLAALGGALAGAAIGVPGAWASPLDKVKAKGVLTVAVYKDYEPWSWMAEGRLTGIDVDLAALLAEGIGVKTDVRQFLAGDDLGDDLRNMVWKGTVVGQPPCDLMMHVPVDRKLQIDNDRAVIAGPYYRETFEMACNRETTDCEVPPPQLKGKRLVVETASIPDMYLSGAFGGSLRADVRHVYTGADAVAAVASGDADATVATRAQIEHGMKPGGRLIERKGLVPLIFNPGWNVGFAVRDDSRDLADELEKQMTAVIADGRMKAIFARYGVVHREPILS
ncbi:substrate-binding periplasmic protein [Sphingomonas pruni]|uniref:substrate-binding periplasmic protein n=1 Tax=Sphingomonas pruni TaxID=40683 RepID=UPI00082AEC67|nr:transporter substrate-binding domain-containing protein [Sphingomonas pruni]